MTMAYTSWRRRREWVAQHRMVQRHYDHCRQRRALRLDGSGLRIPTIDVIAATDNLLNTYHDLHRDGGQAPGPDGIRYADLGRGEVAAIMRLVSQVIRDGSYRPHRARSLRIPKASGRGQRTLRIQGIIDRVVATALHRALSPVWESIFHDRSYGFRPGRGPWDMLAHLEYEITTHDRWIVSISPSRRSSSM